MVRSQHLTIRTDHDGDDLNRGVDEKDFSWTTNKPRTPDTIASTPSHDRFSSTPLGVRGTSDLRSPGASKTPLATQEKQTAFPDFITQTDRYGNSITPDKKDTGFPLVAIDTDIGTGETDQEEHPHVDTCDTLLESLRMMCCCILPEPSSVDVSPKVVAPPEKSPTVHAPKQILKEDVDAPHNIQLLPTLPREDKCYGKKCLVLDLDETLVHSSFRAVPGADFVIPVQIEDVVHFVYVVKRPGVDNFLVEMAKYYEIIVYTASLDKYADPLLDLLDPAKTIRTRLFRESCVYYEGRYVKDLSLLNRDLSQTIIIDNSPASYIFHPENAIDCSSFIDDPLDRELHHIGSFLKGVKNVSDVRGIMRMWRQWPRIPRLKCIEFPDSYEKDENEEEERQLVELLQL
mmetsp:Transcript_4143/g.7929  ORF Transcript_4143/g.7929 Transcript_4143/m.7929 type:complete len:402 (-) Transcript_4143:2353-3558(-)